MQLVRHLSDIPPSARGGALAIGNFDGVHRGHARIIEQLRQRASAVNGPAIVFTFDPHPVRLLRPDQAPPPLTWTNRKADLLAELGVDVMVVYPTDRALLELTPEEFFQKLVVDHLDARAMVEGPNFFFGHNRTGTIERLAELCKAAAIDLQVVEPLIDSDAFISSSRVRQLVHEGQLDAVRRLLTQPYRIRGMVTHGAARGTSIGFPTANIDAVDTLLPGKGVYVGRAYVNGKTFATAIHVGPNPTFGEEALKVEAHLLDFDGSLYGQPLEVDFIKKLRDIRPFASVAELVAQLGKDVTAAKRISGAPL